MNAVASSRLADRLSRWTRPRERETLPIRIDRRRVYVLPTRFGLFYLLLVGTMALGALNYNNNPALLLALLLAGAGLASLVAAHLQLSGLNVDAIAAEPVPAGMPMPLRLAFSARDDRRRDGLRIDIDDAHGLLSMPAHQGGIAEIQLPTEQRGWLDIDRIQLATTRPLGLARAWSILRPGDPWLVYPRPNRTARRRPTSSAMVNSVVRTSLATTCTFCALTSPETPCAASPGKPVHAATS